MFMFGQSKPCGPANRNPIAHTGCCRHTRDAELPRSYRRVQSTCAIRTDGLRWWL